MLSVKAGFMGPTWGPSGADRTQVGPILAPWTLLAGICWTEFVQTPQLWHPSIQEAKLIIHGMHTSNANHCDIVTPYGDIGWPTLTQVTACCLTTPRYLNQCWLIIKGIYAIHMRANFTRGDHLIRKLCSELTFKKMTTTSPRCQWVNPSDL